MTTAAHTRFGVILAGGSGERFWPVSRRHRPKQLLCLTHPNESMIHEAISRLQGLIPIGHIYVITGRHLVDAIVESNTGLPRENILAEPSKRNTAGALVYATAAIAALHPQLDINTLSFAIVTADHAIGEPALFCRTVDAALCAAESAHALVTCGIVPAHPETGFGYIQCDSSHGSGGAIPHFPVKAFQEKPDLETAKAYVASGDYYWNSGMFFWTYSGFSRELRQAQPAMADAMDQIVRALTAGDQAGADGAFNELPDISIDFALLEKAQKVLMVPGTFPWSDIGAWPALEAVQPPDANGNCTLGGPLAIDTRNCVIYNEPGAEKMAVGVLGVENLAIVVTKDAVLVIPKDRAQDVKAIVQALKDAKAPQL